MGGVGGPGGLGLGRDLVSVLDCFFPGSVIFFVSPLLFPVLLALLSFLASMFSFCVGPDSFFEGGRGAFSFFPSSLFFVPLATPPRVLTL